MFKNLSDPPENISNSTLLIALPSEGNTAQFTLSLLQSNNTFKSIGYLYSENLRKSIGYSSDSTLVFNGQLYYSQTLNLTILNICKGILEKKIKPFTKELISFIKGNNFKQVLFFSGISKLNITDVDILARKINVYYFTNLPNFENKYGFKEIKDAFKIEDEKRKGKIYKEMEYVEGCDTTKFIIQYLLLEKINFLFIFGFCEKYFDPFCAFTLYNKLNLILGISDKEEVILKNEKNQNDVLEDIRKFAKFDDVWKILINEN